MTIQEKRFIRRELINEWLHADHTPNYDDISYYVRADEVERYGHSMRLYYNYVVSNA